MEDKNYNITLADGTILDDLKLNGNNYIFSGVLDMSVFEGNLSPVVISDGENEENHNHMELVQTVAMEGDTWFVLRDVPEREIMQTKLSADIDYLAMMCGVEL